jgi:acylphosphatase
MKRYHMIAAGRVQEVGFRYFVYQTALRYHLTGWVQNLYDGTVELEIQGSTDDLFRFEKEIAAGNRIIRVDELTKTELAPLTSEAGFKIAN